MLLLQSSLAREQQKRAADRAGRIKAEQQLKHLHLQLAAAAGSRQLQQGQQAAAAAGCAAAGTSSGNGAAAAAAAAVKPPELVVFPFTAIGTLRSCFTSRWAPSAHGRLTILLTPKGVCWWRFILFSRPDVPEMFFFAFYGTVSPQRAYKETQPADLF